MTKMSAISMMPALMVCTSSPMPGTSTTMRHVGEAHNVDFILADADGLDHHHIAAAGIEHRRHVGCG